MLLYELITLIFCVANSSRMEEKMGISARNQLAGEIVKVTEGAVNASVTLKYKKSTGRYQQCQSCGF
jgi:hypothetical protein